MARVAANDPNAAEKTWERTRIIKENGIWGQPQAQAIAQGVLNEVAGREPRFPTMNFRCDPSLDWGDVLTPMLLKPKSDSQLNLNGLNFRVLQPKHILDFDTRQYDSSATIAPLTASGL